MIESELVVCCVGTDFIHKSLYMQHQHRQQSTNSTMFSNSNNEHLSFSKYLIALICSFDNSFTIDDNYLSLYHN